MTIWASLLSLSFAVDDVFLYKCPSLFRMVPEGFVENGPGFVDHWTFCMAVPVEQVEG